MNKLDKAHDYVVKLLEHGDMTPEEIVETSWFIVDLMQNEYDKREQELNNRQNSCRVMQIISEQKATEGKILKQDDWQPDWSVAPENMIYFAVDHNGDSYFYEYKPYISEGYDYWGDAESKYEGLSAKEWDDHDYQGDWKQSLRERPKTVSESSTNVESKKYYCNCTHWKNSSFFMGDTFKCNDCGGMVTI